MTRPTTVTADTPGMRGEQHTPTREADMARQQMYRQGDVAVVRVSDMPQGAIQRERENGRVVLAHGEVTGHAHVVTGPAELFDADRQTFLRVGEGAEIRHEEHSTIPLPAGVYQVIRQREYQPAGIVDVAD